MYPFVSVLTMIVFFGAVSWINFEFCLTDIAFSMVLSCLLLNYEFSCVVYVNKIKNSKFKLLIHSASIMFVNCHVNGNSKTCPGVDLKKRGLTE